MRLRRKIFHDFIIVLDQARFLVCEGVKGVLPVIRAHATASDTTKWQWVNYENVNEWIIKSKCYSSIILA